MELRILTPDKDLSPDEFIHLFNILWPRMRLDAERVATALGRTINITVRDSEKLIGCVRVLSDDCIFSTICEIIIHPDFENQGIGKMLLEHAYNCSSSDISIGVQKVSPELMTRLGWEYGPITYYKRK